MFFPSDIRIASLIMWLIQSLSSDVNVNDALQFGTFGIKSIKVKLSVPKFKNINELFRYLLDIQPSYNEKTNELDVLIAYAKKAYGTIKTIVCPDNMKHFTYAI